MQASIANSTPSAARTILPGACCLPSRKRRGFSFLELTTALAITLLFIFPIGVIFISLLRVKMENSAKLNALSNARAAMETLCKDLAALDNSGPLSSIVVTQPYGDGIDNDSDGNIDNQPVDGGAATLPGSYTDNHAVIDATAAPTPIVERPHRAGMPDIGDTGVETDTPFTSTTLSFQITSGTLPPTPVQVTYTLQTTWQEDSSANVLTRSIVYSSSDGTAISETAPVAFGVLSFRVFYWNPNAAATTDADFYWKNTWDSAALALSGATFNFPASFYLHITTYADAKPLPEYKPKSKIQTVTLRTVLNNEPVINNAAFPRD